VSRVLWLVVFLCCGLAPRSALAHDFRPGVLKLVERAPGEFLVAWAEPVDADGAPAGVRVVPPKGCSLEAKLLLCGETGLSGTLGFEGVRAHRVRIVVVIERIGRDSEEHLVSGEAPSLSLQTPPAGFSGWLGLGTEHVLSGLDHLGFVIGLMLIVPFGRRLLWTLTAFTLAHSLTLCLAALDLASLSRAPVEAAIAASVLLVAREAMHRESTLTRSAPWFVAAVFGLVHGLGFAGALGEIGLPSGGKLEALVAFNLGVELGQLLVVIPIALAVTLAGPSLRRQIWIPRAACYAIGALAAWWLAVRTLELVTAAW
jgi:hydrogenase/urease accessory protein HupE